jgi:Domain of unknown function (DUF6268)
MLRPFAAMNPLPFSIAALLLFAASISARAGDMKSIPNDPPITEASSISWEVETGFSAVDGAKFKGLTHTDDISVLDTSFSAIASIQSHEGLIFRLGTELQRFDFSRPSSAPAPFGLESVALVLGADFKVGSAWLGRIDFKPGLYGSNQTLRAQNFNVPINLGVSYFVSADLQLVVGASVDANRKYPVIPAVGARWKFAPDWVLNAILPTPRLEYTLNRSVTLYTGADFQGGTYRLSNLPEHSPKDGKLRNGIVDYTQIRVGAGTTWSINNRFTLEVEAGVVPVHEFDYHRAETRLRTKEIPPYAGISLKAEF